MSSRREQILAAIATTLAPTPVERSRVVALARADGTAAWVEPLQDTATQAMHNRIDWELITRVGIVARGAVPDQAADPMVTDVHARLMADLTLGGLAYDVQPRSTSWQLIDEDNAAAVVLCEFAVLYRTTLQSIEG